MHWPPSLGMFFFEGPAKLAEDLQKSTNNKSGVGPYTASGRALPKCGQSGTDLTLPDGLMSYRIIGPRAPCNRLASKLSRLRGKKYVLTVSYPTARDLQRNLRRKRRQRVSN